MSGELMHGGELDVRGIEGTVELMASRGDEWLCFDLTRIEAVGLAQQLLKAAKAETVTP